MHTRVVKPRHGPEILVRPLRDGDTGTVQAAFERLGETSRLARFNGLKRQLGEMELRWLSNVGANHHVLVAYVDGDPEPAALARLVRSDNPRAFAVLRRALGRLEVRFEGPETSVRAAMLPCCASC